MKDISINHETGEVIATESFKFEEAKDPNYAGFIRLNYTNSKGKKCESIVHTYNVCVTKVGQENYEA